MPAAGSVAARRSDPAEPAARTRCPRCAYALTGLPGAPDPANPYAATTAEIRCPECALVVPSGSICLVGGASSGVVDPNGARSAWISLAGVIGAAMGHLLGLEDVAALQLSYVVLNSAVTRIEFDGNRRTLVSFNSTAHLERADRRALLTYL